MTFLADDDCTACYAALAATARPTAPEDPCAHGENEDYNTELHIAAIFLVAVVSCLGALLPAMAKRSLSGFHVTYAILLGKSAGIGIVLACALIHMLEPAVAALTSVCVPPSFSQEYPGYAYLFALISAVFMHAFEGLIKAIAQQRDRTRTASSSVSSTPTLEEPLACSLRGEEGFAAEADLALEADLAGLASSGHAHGANNLSSLSGANMEGVAQALMLEFSFSAHSVFIGMAVGIVGEEFAVLLTALLFHQFFEGISLGARIVDANFPSWWYNAGFVLVFAGSAPLGIAIGVLAYQTLNVNSVTFLLVQGTFDGVCAGILLYAGFVVLLIDFPKDLAVISERRVSTALQIFGAYAAIWIGAGAMALLGLFL